MFSEAEGRVGGDERGTFFDTFVTLCGGHVQLAPGPGLGGSGVSTGPDWGDLADAPHLGPPCQ
jgi:hypothetical protein